MIAHSTPYSMIKSQIAYLALHSVFLLSASNADVYTYRYFRLPACWATAQARELRELAEAD